MCAANAITHAANAGALLTNEVAATNALADERVVRRVQATMALQKIAEPEDVARAIVFLTSDALAGHISGAIVPIAGGMEGRLLHPELL